MQQSGNLDSVAKSYRNVCTEFQALKVPRVRFSLRRMILIVAAISLVCPLLARYVRLIQIAASHENQILVGAKRVNCRIGPQGTLAVGYIPTESGLWHYRMKEKYKKSSFRPWLPVEPDPPPP
jgi:hypothetical protein